MRITFFSLVCVASMVSATALAGTVQIFSPLATITARTYDAGGRLCNTNLTGSDVSGWLSGQADGWYTTTGNNDIRWGYASIDATAQSLSLPNMNGTAGVCAGQKLTVNGLDAYTDMTFSFTLTPPASTGSSYTWSLWYETTTGSTVQLAKESKGSFTTPWNVSYTVEGTQYAEMAQNGNGKMYVVLGSTGGPNGPTATITDLSLMATEAVVPEPAAATLGLLGFASLLMRRRRS